MCIYIYIYVSCIYIYICIHNTRAWRAASERGSRRTLLIGWSNSHFNNLPLRSSLEASNSTRVSNTDAEELSIRVLSL